MNLTDISHKNHYKWAVLFIATLAQAAACFFVQGIGPLAGYFEKDLNLTNSQIGMISSAAQLFPIIGLLIAGELLDRFSERFIIGLGAIFISITLLLGAYTTTYAALLICLFFVGAFYSSAQPGGAKSVASWFPSSQRGFAMGIRQAGLPLGGALAAVLLPFMANKYGLQGAFITGSIISFMGGVIFILFYRNNPVNKVKEEKIPSEPFSYAMFKKRLMIIREPYMKKIVCSGVTLVTVQYIITIFLSIYFHQKYQLSLEKSAYLFFIAQIAGVIGRILLAFWGDHCRSGRFFPIYFCIVSLILGFISLLVNKNDSMIILSFLSAWLGFFGLGWYGPWVSYIADESPENRVGFSLGFAMAVNQVFIILSPPIFGFIQDKSGSYNCSWIIIILMLIISLIMSKKGAIKLNK